MAIEYDVYVPLNYNDGLPIETKKISAVEEGLIARFGGLTVIEKANGSWIDGDTVCHDRILIFRVIVSEVDMSGADSWMARLIPDLCSRLYQKEILITRKAIDIVPNAAM